MRKAKQSGESVWEVQLFWSSRKVRNKIEGGDNYQHITFTEHILYASLWDFLNITHSILIPTLRNILVW